MLLPAPQSKARKDAIRPQHEDHERFESIRSTILLCRVDFSQQVNMLLRATSSACTRRSPGTPSAHLKIWPLVQPAAGRPAAARSRHRCSAAAGACTPPSVVAVEQDTSRTLQIINWLACRAPRVTRAAEGVQAGQPRRSGRRGALRTKAARQRAQLGELARRPPGLGGMPVAS